MVEEEPGQASAIGAGALDPDPQDRTEGAQPHEQPLVAGDGGSELFNAKEPADGIQDRGDMSVEVGVDAADDGALGLYDGHVAIPSLANVVKGWHALAGTADGDPAACPRGARVPPPDR